ncbi:SSI family serine proteinase inhibitor [Streptomyces albireticuli]|uniref:Protease inhibitor n=1 Tax=Streptomyces albireticuli TaxID=1940 RepID=A0A2A2DFH8_9ACTN|nr:SSI family serine proteinase inhibitor [Streptomyces albireticuli]MCD9145755.1 protease inhibitor [Streptomyces albireticuli]MCD9165832.1 protease inhibitor [Streptomyces albireticuli]MCD9194489.1 protease inhibitor [Streptomyces albireticuli]PAU50285.1 protease inhibitor [Streptomyces albireticuli]
MSVRTTVAVAATATALLCLAAVPAATASEPERGRLFLTVSGAQNTWIRGVQLTCPDAGGHHPHAAAACADLQRAKGEPDALAGEGHLCTREYDPVTATVEGDWNGRPLVWHKTYPNACGLDAATGAVFRF